MASDMLQWFFDDIFFMLAPVTVEALGLPTRAHYRIAEQTSQEFRGNLYPSASPDVDGKPSGASPPASGAVEG